MSIYRRKSGRWAVLFEQDATSTGLRRRKSLGTYATKKEAEKAEREALGARDRGIDLSPARITIAELMTRYLRDRAGRCGVKTIEEYERCNALYIVPRLGSLPLLKLRPAHVSEWQSELELRGGVKGNALSPKTVFHARSLLYGALGWAMKMQLVGTNACAAVDAPRMRKSEAKSLSADEIGKLLSAASSTRWNAFITLALTIGARRGELLAIRWTDVDFERKSLTIRGALTQTTRSGIALKSTKTDTIRTVPLSRLAIEALQRQRKVIAADKLRAGGHYEDRGFVFATELGQWISPKATTIAYARIARRAGISSTRLHDTRHTVATTLLTSGVDVRTTAGVLGHSSPIVTMSTYAHLLEDSQRDAVDRLGAVLDAIASRDEKKA